MAVVRPSPRGAHRSLALSVPILPLNSPDMNQSSIPQSRTYRHLKCRELTIVSEEAFSAISDPLSDMTRTWCNACNAHFPLSEYEWADTGENITDYYARHGARATKLERFLCSRRFLVIVAVLGFLAGAVGGYLLFRDKGGFLMVVMTLFVGGIGVVVFASLKEFGLGKLIAKRVCGVSDTRLLK